MIITQRRETAADRTTSEHTQDEPTWLAVGRPVLLGVLAQACAVGLLVVSGWLLSRAAEHPPVLYLMTTIVAVRALGLGRGVLRYRERLAGHDVALRFQARLRVRAFERLASGAPIRRDGELLSRLITDVDAVQDLLVRVIVPVVSAGLMIIAAGTAITVISLPVGLVLLAGSVVSGVLLPLLTAAWSSAAASARAPLRAELAAEIAVIARARLDLSAYGADTAALERLDLIDGRLGAAERRSTWLAGLAAALQWLVTGSVIIIALLSGGRAVAAGDLDPVLLAVLALTPLAMHEVVAALPAAAQTALHCRTALRRVRDLLGPDSSLIGRSGGPGRSDRRGSAASARSVAQRAIGAVTPVPGDRAAGPAITLDGLAIGWPGGPLLADGIDLHVGAGERVALVGPSGVGKSTVAATLMGYAAPLAGRLRVDGRVGYLAQDAHVFDTTVLENVRIGRRDASADQVRAALDEVGLAHLALDRSVGEFGGRISGGEARRLALARLLVADCTVLILDEPTEHLDAETAAGIVDLIMNVRPGAAKLLITHDPELITRCDRVLTLARRRTAPPDGATRSSAAAAATIDGYGDVDQIDIAGTP